VLDDIIHGKHDLGIQDLHLQVRILDLLLRHLKKYYAIKYLDAATITDTEKIAALGQFIIDNPEKPIHVDKLAQACGKSQSEFHRLFKLHWGESPHHFVLVLRVTRALQMIRFTDYPIGHIAASVGFEDISSFNKAFKKQLGQSPSFFREQIQEVLPNKKI
jgi:AraC family transcriptional regulator